MPFSVDQNSLIADGLTAIITGTKDPVHVISVDGSTAGVTNTSNTSWKFPTVLVPGTNTFKIAASFGGLQTDVETVTITIPILEQVEDFWFGVLDRHGLLLSLPRNRGERNLSYRQRILDVFTHIGNSSVSGLLNSISRELGLKVEDEVVTIGVAKDSFNKDRATSAKIHWRQIGIYLTAEEIVTDETVQIETADLTTDLTNKPFQTESVVLQTLDGIDIPKDQFSVDKDGRVTFTNRAYSGAWIKARYQYWEVVETWQKSLAQFKSGVEAITDSDGNSLFSISVTGDTSRTAEGLTSRDKLAIADETESTSGWSAVIVRELGDPEFQAKLLNSDGTAFFTELEKWALKAKINSRVLWGLTVLDVDSWDAEEQTRQSGFLPHLRDAKMTQWFARTLTVRYNAMQRFGFGGYDPNGDQKLELDGFRQNQFNSGIGNGNDLEVDITEVIE